MHDHNAISWKCPECGLRLRAAVLPVHCVCGFHDFGGDGCTGPAKPFQLGDAVSSALAVVGITEQRVSRWLGANCGCAERREKLNRLGEWAASVTAGGIENAKAGLAKMLGG